jgi:hypothetical protein
MLAASFLYRLNRRFALIVISDAHDTMIIE